ncbi:MAG: hypothetical protein ACLT2T_07515 [Bilophila wadsworthia]
MESPFPSAPNWTLPNKRRTFAFWPAVCIHGSTDAAARLLEQAPCRAARPWTASG